ncbi:hypothetical protein EDC04DRAFT_2610296 [Pisolithus marmoratus]|nr:hypothetical protein EDC04DRAFT_2610296 [Pisolithus marmoratus]
MVAAHAMAHASVLPIATWLPGPSLSPNCPHIPAYKAPPIQQPKLQHSLSSFNSWPINGAVITLDTHSSSQSSPDINTPKWFEAVLQKVCRSIHVNPEDVDYGICRRGFQYISRANHVKQMKVFTRVGPNKFKVISAITKDISLIFSKPRLTYNACNQVLIVKMPSALHKDELKTVLEKRLDCLPSCPSQSMVHANVHMNCSIRFGNKLPDLVAVMMIVIWEDIPFSLSQKKSTTWEYFKSCGRLLSQKEFLDLCADLNELIHLSKSIIIGGHIWCHLATVEYFIWVREVRGNPINIDNSSTDSTARGMLFPEVRMGEVDAMLSKAISSFKGSIILFFERLGEFFSTGEVEEAIGPLKISWTDCQGCLTGDARGGNLTNTTRTNTHLASLTTIPNHSSSSSPSSSDSEVLSSSDASSAADDAIYGTGDV